jgi:gamma-glutamyltranspeptidase / glutathione hydrolase
MMTDRWLNYVLSIVVIVGLLAVTAYNQPRDREERAAFLDQDLVELDGVEVDTEVAAATIERTPIELRPRTQPTPSTDAGDDAEPAGDAADSAGDTADSAGDAADATDAVADADETDPALGSYGVSASHPLAVETGMQVLEAGGNAVDAAVAVAYTLGVVEPFGSGIGGGGAMLIKPLDDPARYVDYREVAPPNGVAPVSDIGIPGFVAGMEYVHDEFGTIQLADLIEAAARYAEDGFEVDPYLNERLDEAAHRLPIHLLPRFFPDGVALPAGTWFVQPEYGEALRLIQEQGADAVYAGPIGEQMAASVRGLEMDDLAAYEVMEAEPAVGAFAGYELLAGGAPIAAPAVVQLVQTAEAAGVNDLDLDSAEAFHVQAQSWRLANGQRIDSIGDPTVEDVDLPALLDPEVSAEFAALIPDDAFVELPDDPEPETIETDTTHVVVVDEDGMMVSMTNTLSNFFGSGMPVMGFFMNDQLKNFAPDPASINHVGPLKRPRSFIAPMMVLEDDRPVLGIGSPGGRRIPTVVGQVLVRWAGHGQSLEEAVLAPRFHLEGSRLLVEEDLDRSTAAELTELGYEVTTHLPTTEYYGAVQALLVDWDELTVTGVDEVRRQGTWAASEG